ncbi:DUF2846 domain-containing protein [Piscinibacter aquaticus]|uniref:DUF2846 domain-containing protein n=1 Tax=Piscinibacter aquaticus TaxID=392597 RepID=A0A5C6U3C1_9BURK|nr:DUF2846 domain-containing protein [Piscinibacter aquaticus]
MKRSITRRLAIVAAAALLSACASGPKHAEVQSSIPALKASEGRLYVYRSGSMLGAAIQPNVVINGKVAGESKPGGFFFVDLPPGTVEVSTSTEVEKKLSLTLDAGQTRYVRTSVGFGLMVGRVYPELVDNAQGAKEIAETSYIGKPLAKP